MGHGYREIAAELRGRIDSGEFAPGTKVPGENELMAAYGVSQPTARRALDVLKNEGLIYARRGSGAFVREFQPLRRVSPDRLKAEVWGAGRSAWSCDADMTATVDSIEIRTEQAPPHVAHILELTSDQEVVMRSRRFLMKDKPVQIATSYYPAELVVGTAILQPDTGPGGAYARLADLGHEPVHFREELRVRMPREDESAALELTPGTPVIMVVRTAYTTGLRPIEVNEMILDSNSYVLEYKFSAHS